MKKLTQGELKENLHYDADTGLFTWAKNRQRVGIGSLAGCLDNYGYRVIGIDGKQYKAHRLAFLYMTGKLPPNEIDHINHSRDDNRFVNLRHATRVENLRNKSMHSNNKSGFTGVYWEKALNKWAVNIWVNGKNKYLGNFTDIKEAIACRKKANIDFGFHQNHGAIN